MTGDPDTNQAAGRDDDTGTEDRPLSTAQVVGSVLASFFGVQSRRNRERDFTRGKPVAFIIAGVLATLAFILVLMVAVRVAISQAPVG